MRRRELLGVVGGLAAAAGCVSPRAPGGNDTESRTATRSSIPDSTGTDSMTATPTPGEADRQTSPSATRTETVPGHEAALDEPKPDHDVRLVNDHDESHTVRVSVHRASGETVYEARHEVEPRADRSVYNLRAANPDGIETFTVRATLGDTTESVSVATNACYGDAFVEITGTGTLYLYYAIC